LAAHSEKIHDSQHILGKNKVVNTFWGKNMIGSTFWRKKHGWSQSCFPTKFTTNYIFLPECAANHVVNQNVLSIMFFSQNMLPIIGSTFWGKHD
jgi:hypothetical protein